MELLTAAGLGITRWDSGAGDPVVFLHGFMGFASDWEPFARRIASDSESIAVDLPGHGRSVNLTPECYSIAGATDRLDLALEEIGISRSRFVGYSMGGRLALAFAAAFPDRVSALLLLAASPGLADRETRVARLKADRERAEAIRRDYHGFLSDWISMPLFDPLRRHQDLVEGLLRRRKQLDPRELALVIEGFSPGLSAPVWDKLGTFDFEVWAVAGSLDSRYTGVCAQIAGDAPRGRYFEVEGAGHAVHLERPEGFASLLEHFAGLRF